MDCQIVRLSVFFIAIFNVGYPMQIRKDVTKLSQQERMALVKAMEKLIDDGTYGKLANFHGAPLTMCDPTQSAQFRSGCCPHRSDDFLVWHRLYLVNMDRVSLSLL